MGPLYIRERKKVVTGRRPEMVKTCWSSNKLIKFSISNLPGQKICILPIGWATKMSLYQTSLGFLYLGKSYFC